MNEELAADSESVGVVSLDCRSLAFRTDLPLCFEPYFFGVPLLSACTKFFGKVIGSDRDVLV